jgi:hypothetical protein
MATGENRRASAHPAVHRISAGSLALLEILVLGPIAALVVLRFVPDAFAIESECFGAGGSQRVAGDTYNAGMVVAGTFGWLFVLVGVVFAEIAESRRVTVLLPIVWFVALVVTSLLAALAIGSQPCPS